MFQQRQAKYGKEQPLDEGKAPPPNPACDKQQKVSLMENERVVFYHEIRPNQSFRIVATGDVDAEMIKALKAFADFQEAITPKSPGDGESKGNS
jgi:hypothetical protein